MAGKKITLQIQGNPTEGGDVKLTAFLDKLEAFKNALLHTERLISGNEKQTVAYRIVHASHNSPIALTFEASAVKPKNPLKKYNDLSESTVQTFLGNLMAIKKKTLLPGRMDKLALNSYLKLGDKFGEDVFGIEIKNGESESVGVDNEFVQNIVDYLGKEEIVFGSMTGKAEAFNVHDNSIFYIYPTIGPTRVVCRFPKSMDLKAKNALLKYVRVTGNMKFKPTDTFPYEIEVTHIEELPDSESLPTLMSLRGIITEVEKEKSEVTIRRGRDANW
jgi:hypothetical protein